MIATDSFQRPWLGRPAVLALDAAPRPPRRTADGRLIGSAIRPSAGVRAHYDARLRRLVNEMHASVAYWLRAAYRRQGERISALAGDAAYISGSPVVDGLGGGYEATTIVEPPPQRYIRVEDEADPARAGPHPRAFPPGSVGNLPLASSSLVAVPVESIVRKERADHNESTVKDERAGTNESTALKERAAGTESTEGAERLVAADARPSTDLEDVIRRLRYRWLRRFDEGAQDLARYFAQAVWQRSDAELKKILKRAGFTVEFTVSQTVRDALAAIVAENVALIRSIPEQYLGQVEGSVLRSVVAGGDLKTLTDELEHHYGVTRQRAELIATHQNHSATGAIQRLQYLEVGIERAIWRHSHSGKFPRPTHVANDGKEYDVRTGWWDPHEQRYIRTGELIHCRCYSQPVMPR